MADSNNKGMTALEAANKFCAVEDWWHDFDFRESQENDCGARATESQAVRRLAQLEQDGSIQIKGYRVPFNSQARRENITASMLAFLRIDWEQNRAVGGGEEYVELMVYNVTSEVADSKSDPGQGEGKSGPPENVQGERGRPVEKDYVAADEKIAVLKNQPHLDVEKMTDRDLADRVIRLMDRDKDIPAKKIPSDRSLRAYIKKCRENGPL